MNVKKLKEALADADDDMPVVIVVDGDEFVVLGTEIDNDDFVLNCEESLENDEDENDEG